MSDSSIVIRGAREHNLRDIDVSIPRDQLVVITGLSGSGKSSLAFDTIYAEGQRRYVESLSSYARQFLGQMDKPDLDSIDGLSPAVSIDQKTTSKNPRSTVGTVTEIYDYLRLLFARVGTPHCPECGRVIERQTTDQVADKVLAAGEGRRAFVLAPVVRGRKGEYAKLFEDLRAEGFSRVRVDGEVRSLDDPIDLDKKFKHDIEVVVDRLVVKGEEMAERVAQSVETALKIGDGILYVDGAGGNGAGLTGAAAGDGSDAAGMNGTGGNGAAGGAGVGGAAGNRLTFSAKYACPVSGFTIEEIEPRLFSFKNPLGAGPHCDGLGARLYMDEKLVVPNEGRSIAQGAIAPWYGFKSAFYKQTLISLCDFLHISQDTPWKDLPEYGTAVSGNRLGGVARGAVALPVGGAVHFLQRQAAEARGAGGQSLRQGHYGSFRPFHQRGAEVVCRGGRTTEPAEAADCAQDIKGDYRPAAVFEQCGAGLPDAVAAIGRAFRRRIAAYQAGVANRVGADGRAVCAGRTVNRAAPARQ